jgi:hypothetical protein
METLTYGFKRALTTKWLKTTKQLIMEISASEVKRVPEPPSDL